MTKTLAAVILAGGDGRRIGGAKSDRLLGGQRLVDLAIRSARRWTMDVVVATRSLNQVQAIDAQVILDEAAVEGPLAGLIAGLDYARREQVDLLLSLPVDTPFLPPDLAERLMAGLGNHACAIAHSGGQLHFVCGLWRSSALAAARSYASSGGRSLKGFAAEVGFATVTWTDDPDPFANVNDQQDLAEAELRLSD